MILGPWQIIAAGGESRGRNPMLENEQENEPDSQARARNRKWGVGARSRSFEFRKVIGRASKV